jgi:hypothetical protein
MRKLTIGTVVYDDFDGLYFSLQAIRMYHSEVINDIEFVVINTNPNSPNGRETKNFCTEKWIQEPLQYFEDDNKMGTATRTKIFDYAKTPYVLVMDSHILLEAGSLKKLIEFFDAGEDEGNLIQGPILYDNLAVGGTHFEPIWSHGMYGKWAIDQNYKHKKTLDIPGNGLGVFACRKDSWLGFNKNHTGFGGEEIMISKKFEAAGRKTLCLTSLKWLHRFKRPNGVPYPNKYEDRIKNYFRSYLELDLPVYEVIEHFSSLGIAEETLRNWLNDVINSNAIR